MIGLALGLAALLAVIVVAWRTTRDWQHEASRPGRSEESAIRVTDYGEIDAIVIGQRCRCGGRFSLRGEGPRGSLRVAHLECRSCGRERVIYFDLRAVRH